VVTETGEEPMLNEQDVWDLLHRIYGVSPLWTSPFDIEDESEWDKFYENVVASDLWRNFDLIIHMFSHPRQSGWSSATQTHLSDLLAAICRLAPEQYIHKATPLLEQPELREIRAELMWSVGKNELPQTIEWLKPWLSRLEELSDGEIDTIVEIIALVGAKHPQLLSEAQNLLQQIRTQVPEENGMHTRIDSYLSDLNKRT
jgi:hypothetical protein